MTARKGVRGPFTCGSSSFLAGGRSLRSRTRVMPCPDGMHAGRRPRAFRLTLTGVVVERAGDGGSTGSPITCGYPVRRRSVCPGETGAVSSSLRCEARVASPRAVQIPGLRFREHDGGADRGQRGGHEPK